MADPVLDGAVTRCDVTPGKMPGHYTAVVTIQYERSRYGYALASATRYLAERYAHVAGVGHNGSPGNDHITLSFWSSGPLAPVVASADTQPF